VFKLHRLRPAGRPPEAKTPPERRRSLVAMAAPRAGGFYAPAPRDLRHWLTSALQRDRHRGVGKEHRLFRTDL